MCADKPPAEERVRSVYGAGSLEEIEESYDAWAGDYDNDLLGVFGYAAPSLVLPVVERYVAKDGEVLEAGVGTGLAGQALFDAGYRNLTGIDLSHGMLKQARRRRIYRALERMALGDVLDFETDRFDAAVCVGTLTTGHAPAHSLEELARVVRPEGHVIFTLKSDSYDDDGFKDEMDRLADSGRWRLLERSGPVRLLPGAELDVEHEIWAYSVID